MSDRSRSLCLWLGIAAAALLLQGCPWRAPITTRPTRLVDQRLLGDWFSANDGERLLIRRLDDTQYILFFDRALYRAVHTDVASLPLVSVQQLDEERRYNFFSWALSEDGTTLTLHTVNPDVIPDTLTTSDDIAKAIAAKQKDPGLLKDEQKFVRVRK